MVVIERSSPGAEASRAAAGMLAPQAEADCADSFFALACRGRDLYPEFAAALLEETGIDIELDQTGTLYVAFAEHDVLEIEERYRWQARADLAVEKLTGAEARRLEPCLSDVVRAALRFPKDVQVENRRLVSALCEANERSGVRLLSGVTVNSISHKQNQITGLETSQGFLSAPRVVVAAGSWTSFLNDRDSRLPSISIEPVRGQMVSFEMNPRLTRHVIYSPRGYIVPRIDGRLLAGSTSEHAGFDKRVTGGGLHSILTNALEIAPAVAQMQLLDSWAGLRPRAPDNLPVLGPYAEIEGLFYATGHYRNGILLAPITGELLAEAIVSGTVSPLMKPFGPDRFSPVSTN